LSLDYLALSKAIEGPSIIFTPGKSMNPHQSITNLVLTMEPTTARIQEVMGMGSK